MKRVYLIAVIVALVAGFATFLFAKEISERSSYADAQKNAVIVAITDVPQNTTITEENYVTYFTEKDIIADDCVPGYIGSMDECVGTVIRQEIYSGEQLSTNKLITADSEDATLSLTIPDGYVAYPISASGTNAADGYIAVGDHVDVYVYDNGQTNVMLSNLEVFKVSSKAANDTAESEGTKINDYSTLTFIVTPDQAKLLNQIENGMTYKLVLKPRVSSQSNTSTSSSNTVE